MNGRVSACTRAFAERAPSVEFGRGRTCAHEGCDTPLSTYNPDGVCWLHRHDWDPPDYIRSDKSNHHEARFDGLSKECRHCGRHKPRTTEYWAKCGGAKDGLHPWCKACKNERDRHRRITIVYPNGKVGVQEVTR